MRFEQPAPTRARKRRTRWLPLVGLSLFLTLLLLIASVSAWNYYDISLGLPSPASAISESVPQSPALSAPPSGIIEWSFHARDAIAAPPVVHQGVIYLTVGSRSQTGKITAIDLDSGRAIWSYPLLSIAASSPTVTDDFLYVGARGGKVIALKRDTGQEMWIYQAESLLHGSPVVSNGILYIASDRVHALDALTGKVIWIHEPQDGKAIGPLAHSQGIIAVLSAGNHLNLIDAAKGRRRLTAKLWFGVGGAPVIFDDAVAVTGDGGSIQTFDLFARDIPMEKALRFWWTKLWLYKSAPRPPDPVGYSWHHRGVGGLSARIASVGDSRLFLIARHPDHRSTVVAIDTTSGQKLWDFSPRALVSEIVALSGDALIVGAQAGELYGLHASSGETAWEVSLEAPIEAVHVATNDAILITTQTGALHKIR